MKNLIFSEQPRERLLRDGVEALSLQELLAILLGTGMSGKPVLQLATELLSHFGKLDDLLDASVEELTQFKGVGKTKAILLKAAFGFAHRCAKSKSAPLKKILSHQDALDVAVPAIGHLKKEALLVILRDVKCQMIHHEVISLGILSEVLVHPREVFAPALRHHAHSLLICHNHPSKDPRPSEADLVLTRKLSEAANLLGIALVDHLIIGGDSYLSMKKLGLI